jgi:hypothetical protein
MLEILRGMGAAVPASLREPVRGQRGSSGDGAITWPEAVREAARAMEPPFALATRKLPHGRPAKASALQNPIRRSSKRAVISAQILTDVINGTYNGVQLPANLSAGDPLSLEWILTILDLNHTVYRKVESWQSLSRLLTVMANLSGRYVTVSTDGMVRLTTEDPKVQPET